MTVSSARLVTLAFAAGTLLAGANGVAIRFSNRELSPVWGAALRVGLAAVLLVFIMLALKLTLPRGRVLLGVMLFGLIQFAGGFGFFYIALVQIPAGLGQTILALVLLATLLLEVAQRQERLRGTAVVGSLFGLAGVGLISIDPWRESMPPGHYIMLSAAV